MYLISLLTVFYKLDALCTFNHLMNTITLGCQVSVSQMNKQFQQYCEIHPESLSWLEVATGFEPESVEAQSPCFLDYSMVLASLVLFIIYSCCYN